MISPHRRRFLTARRLLGALTTGFALAGAWLFAGPMPLEQGFHNVPDAALPPPKRITKSNLALQSGPRTLKAYQGFASEDPLMTSGLLGPVRLEFLR